MMNNEKPVNKFLFLYRSSAVSLEKKVFLADGPVEIPNEDILSFMAFPGREKEGS